MNANTGIQESLHTHPRCHHLSHSDISQCSRSINAAVSESPASDAHNYTLTTHAFCLWKDKNLSCTSISWTPTGSWTSHSNLNRLKTLAPPSNSLQSHTFLRWRAMDISFVPPHLKAIFFQLNSLSKTSVICMVEIVLHTQWLVAHRSRSNSTPPVGSQRHSLENDCHHISETIYEGLSLRPEGEGFYYLT
jgi:hypothetical protein